MKDYLKDERMMILQMVNDGKINSEDAAKLLTSLTENDPGITGPGPNIKPDVDVADKFNKFCGTVENFAKNVGEKASKAIKDAEPHVKEATKKAMKKTACALEDISKTLQTNLQNMEEKENNCENTEDSTPSEDNSNDN